MFIAEPCPAASRPVPHPWVWAVLYFPLGLAIGFPSVALGYLGSRSGLAVSAIAAIVGMTFLANGWKFVWAPVGDYTLSRKTWYLIAVSLVALGLVGMTELMLVLRARAGRIALILAILPIGTGAAMFLFSAIAQEFNASADVVSAVLGLGGGVAIVAGCFTGGRLADRVPKPTAYAISCGLGLVACVVIALSPRTSAGYAVSTLLYTFTLGMVTASFTGLVLAIIGESAAATKINLFFALNTLFSLGMLRVVGWAHDAWSTSGMLFTEALTGVAALALFIFLARRVRGSEL